MAYSNSSDCLSYDRFHHQLQTITNRTQCDYLAQLLWNRGIKQTRQLKYLFAIEQHQPTSYLEFGESINRAIERINQARVNAEKVAVWGDWQVESVISACILGEALQDFFPFKDDNLQFYFAQRHFSVWGLNSRGIDSLAKQGVSLIVTLGIGSHNLRQIEYAGSLGIDIIIIDRTPIIAPDLPVVALLNPYLLDRTHPFYHFTEIAIVYKLLEGMAAQSPSLFPQPVTNLLDLVALGLLATATENHLSADERYLMSEGLALIKQAKRHNIDSLAQLGFSIGDRALDSNDGLGRKIQLISSISTDINLIFTLLTNKDKNQQFRLANQAENIYFNCLDLLQKMLDEARKIIKNLDLSNAPIIVLTNTQWHIGLFDLVAEFILKEYGKPILFLSPHDDNSTFAYLCGLQNAKLDKSIDNYSYLIQNYVLDERGIKIDLPTQNVNLLVETIAQQIRYSVNNLNCFERHKPIDLLLDVAQLDESVYQQLKILEPYSFNNPQPRLLIQNCFLTNIFQRNLKSNRQNQKIRYRRTYFNIHDSSCNYCFEGVWHTHYASKLNQSDRYDLIGEIAYNTKTADYYFRVIDCQKIDRGNNYIFRHQKEVIPILDYRSQNIKNIEDFSEAQSIERCPHRWQEINQPYNTAKKQNQKLILSYSQNQIEEIEKVWLQFMGYIKYLLWNNKSIDLPKLGEKLDISRESLIIILSFLPLLSIDYQIQDNMLKLKQTKANYSAENYHLARQKFTEIIKQENLAKKYFYHISIKTINENIELD